MNLVINQIDPARHSVSTSAGKLLGDFLRDVDGYFYWWPIDRAGCWPAFMLRDLANRLDALNADWDTELDAFFTTQPPETC